MANVLHVKSDFGGERPTKVIRHLSRSAPLFAIGTNMYRDLVTELGSAEAAIKFIQRTANHAERPIGVHIEGENISQTYFVAPSHWSKTRLAAFVAVNKEHWDAAFGESNWIEKRIRPGEMFP